MRVRFALLLAVLAVAPVARADEADDLLAKQLAAVVRDPRLTERQRTEAARSLTHMGPRAAAAVPQLVQQLERLRGNEFESLQEAVIEALATMGPSARPAVPVLARVADRSTDIDLAARKASAAILSTGDDRDIAGLIEQLASADTSLRLRAAKALGGYRTLASNALPFLNLALADADGDVRRAVIAALRLIDPTAKPSKELIAALALDLRDPEDGVRLVAVRTLGRYGPLAAATAPAVEAMALTDPDKDVRKAAAEALLRIAPQ